MPTTTPTPMTPSQMTRLLEDVRIVNLLNKHAATCEVMHRFAGRDRRRIKREIRKARQRTR